MKKAIDVYKDAVVIANSRYIEIMCAAYLKETNIPASEVVQYMLHTNVALTTAGAIYKLKNWVNTKLGDNFSVQYF